MRKLQKTAQTLKKTDLDAPNRETLYRSQVKHWFLENIPGNDWLNPKATLLADYLSPGPREYTYYHRFFVFEQLGDTTLQFEDQIPPPYLVYRNNFSVRKLAAKYRRGEPIGINYFYSIFTST